MDNTPDCKTVAGRRQAQFAKTRSVSIDSKPEEQSDQDLSIQDPLVVSFFHNQMTSVKQTVDFITDKITSNIVMVIWKIISRYAEDVLGVLEKNLDGCMSVVVGEIDEVTKGQIFDELLTQAQDLAKNSFVKITQESNALVADQLETNAKPSLKALLPDDTKANVIDLCFKIISKRVQDETSSYVVRTIPTGTAQKNLGGIVFDIAAIILSEYFQNEYKSALEKMWKNKLKKSNPKQSAIIRDFTKEEAEAVNQRAVKRKSISRLLILLKVSILKYYDIVTQVYELIYHISETNLQTNHRKHE